MALDDIEAGRLIESVDRLNKTVEKLDNRIEELENQLNRGKGVVVGLLLAAAGIGGAASSMFTKWFS